MNLSVEARVKARISTPYINADGRGVRSLDGAPLGSVPLCMLPPKEFHERLKAQREDERQPSAASPRAANSNTPRAHTDVHDPTAVALQALEQEETRLLKKLEQRKVDVLQKLAIDVAKDLKMASEGLLELNAIRAQRREDARRERQVALDAAYARRQDSDEAMEKFVAVSRDIQLLRLVEKEDDVTSRFAKLAAARARAGRVAEESQAEVEDRQARERGVVQAVYEARRLQKQAAEEAEARQRFREELARTTEDRQRKLTLENNRREVQLKADVERAVWRDKANHIVEVEKDLADLASRKEQALYLLVTAHTEAKVSNKYEDLRKLQAEFARHAAEIKLVLDRQTKGKGMHLDALFAAAKDTANKKRVIFHGLELLADATLVPSTFSPPSRPSMDAVEGRTKTVGCMFPEPAPVRRGGPQPAS